MHILFDSIRGVTVIGSILSLLCFGCASRRQLVTPTSDLVSTDTGIRARQVAIVPESALWGTATVSSRGAFQKKDPPKLRVIETTVTLASKSTSSILIALDEASVEITTPEIAGLKVAATSSQKSLFLRSKESVQISLEFPLPPSILPRHVSSFDFLLPLRKENETATVTVRFKAREDGADHGGTRSWYEPYPYGWWGFGSPYQTGRPYWW